MKKQVNNHYLLQAWKKYAKENGGCIQCQHPWYDGECECQFLAANPVHPQLTQQMEMLAFVLVEKKDSQWTW